MHTIVWHYYYLNRNIHCGCASSCMLTSIKCNRPFLNKELSLLATLWKMLSKVGELLLKKPCFSAWCLTNHFFVTVSQYQSHQIKLFDPHELHTCVHAASSGSGIKLGFITSTWLFPLISTLGIPLCGPNTNKILCTINS